MARKRKSVKGCVFISHSSSDKSFVRKLEDALDQDGFKTWLDEKELRVGDQLAAEIGAAIAEAGALIVVVSENSARSSWLVYEVNLATERALRGELRILPVLIGDEELPNELKGRLYADFRSSFDDGYAAILAALKGDTRIARKRSNAISPPPHWRSSADEVEGVMERVFGSRGSVFGGSQFKRIDYDFVAIGSRLGREVEIATEIVLDYGRADPLSQADFDEYCGVLQDFGVEAALLITQRDAEFLGPSFQRLADGRVGLIEIPRVNAVLIDGSWLGDINVGVVDISDGVSTQGLEDRLRLVRQLFEEKFGLA